MQRSFWRETFVAQPIAVFDAFVAPLLPWCFAHPVLCSCPQCHLAVARERKPISDATIIHSRNLPSSLVSAPRSVSLPQPHVLMCICVILPPHRYRQQHVEVDLLHRPRMFGQPTALPPALAWWTFDGLCSLCVFVETEAWRWEPRRHRSDVGIILPYPRVSQYTGSLHTMLVVRRALWDALSYPSAAPELWGPSRVAFTSQSCQCV